MLFNKLIKPGKPVVSTKMINKCKDKIDHIIDLVPTTRGAFGNSWTFIKSTQLDVNKMYHILRNYALDKCMDAKVLLSNFQFDQEGDKVTLIFAVRN